METLRAIAPTAALPGAVGVTHLRVYDTPAPDGVPGGSPHVHFACTEAYVTVSHEEAERRGLGERFTGRVGDFVALAPEIEPADVVTLDKVVCCYADMPALVERAAERARRTIGLVFPRETWWNRVAARVLDAWSWLTRDPVRWRLHRPADIDRVLAGAGFERHDVSRDLIWHVVLYRRSAGTS